MVSHNVYDILDIFHNTRVDLVSLPPFDKGRNYVTNRVPRKDTQLNFNFSYKTNFSVSVSKLLNLASK